MYTARIGADKALRMQNSLKSIFGAQLNDRPKLFREALILSGLVALLVVFLVRSEQFDVREAISNLSELSTSLIGYLLVLSAANFIARAYRWNRFEVSSRIPIRFRTSCVFYWSGFAFGVSPARVGELVRLWFLSRAYDVRIHVGLGFTYRDRVFDLLAILTLIVVFSINPGSLRVPVELVAALIVIGILVTIATNANLMLSVLSIAYRAVGKWPRLFAHLRRVVRLAVRRSSGLENVMALCLSVMAWLFECAAFALLVTSFLPDFSPVSAMQIYAVATIAGAVLLLPGGLAGFEAMAVFMLSTHGVSLNLAVFVTLIIRLTTLWFSVLVGLASLAPAMVLARRITAEGPS